jgi:hypothetical protein
MITKLAVLGLVLFVAWLALFRPGRGAAGPKRKPPLPPPQVLEPCLRCGVYRMPGGACNCDPQSTSED